MEVAMAGGKDLKPAAVSGYDTVAMKAALKASTKGSS